MNKMILSNGCHSKNPLVNSELNDLEECVDWIKHNQLEKVCLQFPDDLLPDSGRIALKLEELLERKVYILGDTTCGSCCVDEVAANHISTDGIVHFGHACLNPPSQLPIFHILPRNHLNVDSIIRSFTDFFTTLDQKIILFYDVANAHLIESIWSSLKDRYSNLVLSKLNCKSNVKFTDIEEADGFVVSGRSWRMISDDKIEDYDALFVGNNDRTLASLAMSIPCKSWCYTCGQSVQQFQVVNNPWLKRRRFLIEKLKDAKTVGIVVATLGIKNFLEALSTIKSILKSKNKKTYMFSVGKPNPAKLANFSEIDAFVVITCQESDIFESREYFKPLLTPYEVELAFNSFRKEDVATSYCLDFRQLLPGGTNYIKYEPSNEPDISLISGELRDNDDGEQLISDNMNALMCKKDGTVAIGKAGANFLLNRSWQGLEQKLGETEIKSIEKGRSGLPVNYNSEPLRKNLSEL